MARFVLPKHRTGHRAMTRDPYKILGVLPAAEEKEIRAAYRSLAKIYHPDAGTGSSAERFRDIQDAYEILCDPVRRAAYDRSVRSQASPSSPVDPGMIRVRRRQEPRMAGTHIDLRDVFANPRAEPILEHPVSEGAFPFPQRDSWIEFEELLFSLDRFLNRNW
jgi:curved DNA-binding protein CbpA